MKTPQSKEAARRICIFHSYEEAAHNEAPREKITSLAVEALLYGDIVERLLPEDALPVLLNQILLIASEAKLPTRTLRGWLTEEVQEYEAEQAADVFAAIAHLPERTRPYQLEMHTHFAHNR